MPQKRGKEGKGVRGETKNQRDCAVNAKIHEKSACMVYSLIGSLDKRDKSGRAYPLWGIHFFNCPAPHSAGFFSFILLHEIRNLGNTLYAADFFWQSFMFLAYRLYTDTHTADFIKKVLGVYTHSVETIYLSLSAQVAVGTFFMKSSVCICIYNNIKYYDVYFSFMVPGLFYLHRGFRGCWAIQNFHAKLGTVLK